MELLIYNCLHLSLSRLIKDREDQYVFYSRGQIEVKGLGRKQTYFVESIDSTEDLSDVIYIKPEPAQEKNSVVEQRGHLLHPENSQLKASFTALSTCTRVPLSLPGAPQFDEPPTTVSNGPRGLEMARPIHLTSSVAPIIEEEEIVTSAGQTNGQANGVTSLFLAESQNSLPTNQSHDHGSPDSSHSRGQKSKTCIIS